RALLVAGALLEAETESQASTIFDLSQNIYSNLFVSTNGPGSGQGISVSQDVTVGGFAFDAYLPSGGDVKFLIWNSDNSALLFSATVSFAASTIPSWMNSGPINFDLVAGNT